VTIASCSIAIPLFAAFLAVEMKAASHPFAPGHVIFDRSLFASYLCNFFSIGSFMGILFYVPLYMQAVSGLSAAGAGLRLIPATLGSVTGSLFGGRYMQVTGKYYWLTIIAVALQVLGMLTLTLFSGPVVTSAWGLLGGLVLSSFGGGIAITTTLINVIANADPKDQAIATACSYLFRSLGSVVGVSVAATVVQLRLREQLKQRLNSGHAADKIVEHVRQSLDYIKQLDPQTRDIVRLCYQKATTAAFAVSVCIACASFLSTWWIREKKLSK